MFKCLLWPEEEDIPENLHRVVYVVINKRSCQYFVCLAQSTSTAVSRREEEEEEEEQQQHQLTLLGSILLVVIRQFVWNILWFQGCTWIMFSKEYPSGQKQQQQKQTKRPLLLTENRPSKVRKTTVK